MSEEQLNIPTEKEPSSFRLIITLGIAGFISGLILVSVYLFTKPIIERNKAEALQAAIFEVLPNTSRFESLTMDGSSLRVVGAEEEAPDEVIYQGFSEEGKSTGFAIPGAEPGYQDLVAIIYGYDPVSKNIIGMKVLESKETPGLGDKIFKDDDFKRNFDALYVEPSVEVVKKGEKKSENEVEAITGATISSKAVVKVLQNTMANWKEPITAFVSNQKDAQE
jgi:electron transport complex protein RnfG